MTDIPGQGVALSLWSFILSDDSETVFVTVSDDWSKRSTIAYITDKKKESVGKMLTGHTTIQESGLSLVRTKCAPNFSIKGSDEETVEVFTPVLTAVWPFFETMLSSGLREASENVVQNQQSKPCCVTYMDKT